MDKKLRRQDDIQIQELETRFDRHLEIYANNGKELAALKEAVKSLERFLTENRKLDDIFREELKPIMNSYSTLVSGRKMILGFIIFVSALGSLYLLIKQILK